MRFFVDKNQIRIYYPKGALKTQGQWSNLGANTLALVLVGPQK